MTSPLSDRQNPHKLPDADVVVAVRDGRPGMFAMLVVRHGRAALRIAERLVSDWATAEDVCQEAFLDAFRRLSHLRDAAKFRQWLFAIVRNRCRKVNRDSRPSTLVSDMDVYASEFHENPADSLTKVEALQIISELCNHLSTAEAPVARMHYVEGIPNREIATRLGISPIAVDSRLFKARKRLRKMVATADSHEEPQMLIRDLIQHVQERYVMDTIRVELSKELIDLVNRNDGQHVLLDSIRSLREDLERTEQLAVPKVHVVDNLALTQNAYEIYVSGVKAGDGAARDPSHPNDILSSLRGAILANRNKLAETDRKS